MFLLVNERMSVEEEYSAEEEQFEDWLSENKERLRDNFFDENPKLFQDWLEEQDDLKDAFFEDDSVNDKFMEFAKGEMRWER